MLPHYQLKHYVQRFPFYCSLALLIVLYGGQVM